MAYEALQNLNPISFPILSYRLPLLLSIPVSMASFFLESCQTRNIRKFSLAIHFAYFVFLYVWLFIIIELSTKMLLHQRVLSGPLYRKYIIPFTTHLCSIIYSISFFKNFSKLKKTYLLWCLLAFGSKTMRIWVLFVGLFLTPVYWLQNSTWI